MNTDWLFKVLSDIHPLSSDFRTELQKEFREISLPKNHFLVEVNAIPDRAYFLLKGFAMSYSVEYGTKTVMAFWEPGKIILSPKSFFEQLPSPEFIQLTENGELLFITLESVNRLFAKFQIANLLARSITANYHRSSEKRVLDLQTLSAWNRYLNLTKAYPGIEQNVSQDVIASYLGITPQSLSRLKNVNRMP